jgi:protein-glutamine gamma-glutamyltransferase
MSILEMMGQYSQKYEYQTIGEIDFELEMRVQIMKAAVALDKSDAEFTTLRTSICNPRYWMRHPSGAFIIRDDVPPHAGLTDIFISGKKYAFECATAMVIIFYKAILETLGKNVFDELFAGLFLYDWQHDQDLDLQVHSGRDYLPGDCVYFKNPAVNPKTSYWRGENGIMMEKNLFFGHGMGMRTSQFIIKFLNSKRIPHSQEPAYLTTDITRMNFQYLRQFAQSGPRDPSSLPSQPSNLVRAEIGSRTYIT